MGVKQDFVIDAEDLTDADRKILDELREGARTKKAIVDSTGLHRNTVGNRLDVLEAGDAVGCIHETTALYGLVSDPRRGEPSDEADLRARLQDALEARDDAQARANRLADELEDCRAQLEDCRDQLGNHSDLSAVERELENIEAAAERGDGDALREALERARGALK